ncbi:MAG: MCP four helix bundle domain-containing protein, partial [Lachnospiraceae bacterium]|nr:MCP four helix bundle domain-containing protein [Lachnospiraceae bacterium]
MFKDLQKLRIEKRLRKSSLITLLLSAVASVIAVIVMAVIIVRYNYTLTYYAFPQGDIALAMNDYAEVRSATRAIIGYTNEAAIESVKAQHDEALQSVEQRMIDIQKSLVTSEGKDAFQKMGNALAAYYEVDSKVIEIGGTTDPEQSAAAQQMMIDELTPLYNAADEAFEELMAINVQKGDAVQSQLITLSIVLIIVIVLLVAGAAVISNNLSTT